MRIYYFTYNANAPSFRYRGRYLLDELKRQFGIGSVTYAPPTKVRSFRILWLLFLLTLQKNTQDVFIFQKICNQDRYFFVLKKILKRVTYSYYDIDDAMHLIKDTPVVNYFVKNSFGVLAASRALVDFAHKTNPRSFFLTTPLPKPIFTKQQGQRQFTIGWIGVYRHVHIDNLNQLFFPVLQKLSFPFTFRLVGVTRDEDERHIRHIFEKNEYITLEIIRSVNWEKEEAVNQEIAQFDIGVDPMFDNEVNRSKSAFKIKQYLACGVPVLASPVGENVYYIENNRNGFLCNSQEEWIDRITFFSRLSHETYARFSQEARQQFEQSDYNLTRAAARLVEILQTTTITPTKSQD